MSSEAHRTPRTAPDRQFWLAFLAAGIASLALLWIPEYLPSTDLPQHAAQIRLWQALDAGDPAIQGRYEIHWLNPYLVGYGLARLFALVAPIPVALKLVLSLYVLGLPLATLDVLRRRGADSWWSLAVFPLAFGVSFYWGFLNFLVGLPVAVLYLGRLRSLLDRPRRLFLATVALLPFHLLLFGWCLGAALVTALTRPARSRRGRIAPIAALLATLPLLGFWWIAMEGSGGVLRYGIRGQWDSARLLELLSYPLGAQGGEIVPALVLLGFLVTLALLARLDRPPAEDVALGGALLAGALVLPQEAFGLDWIAPRFAVFPTVWFLALLSEPRVAWRRRAGRALAVVFALAWPLGLLPSFLAFDREMDGFETVTAEVRPGDRVLGVVPDATSDAVPGHPFGHATAWLRLSGAEPVFEFALLPQSFVQRTDRPLDPVPPGAWHEDPRGAIRAGLPDVIVARRPDGDLVRWLRAEGWSESGRAGAWSVFGSGSPVPARGADEDGRVDGASSETESTGLVE